MAGRWCTNEVSIGDRLKLRFFSKFTKMEATTRRLLVITYLSPRCSLLRGMNRVMTGLASPSGELPHVGDCDDGRVELLLDDVEQMLSPSVSERNALRVSNLLGLGKCLFDEGCGSVEDAKWYGLTHTNRTAPFQAQANAGLGAVATVFPNSGIGILRHRSAE